MVVRLHTPSLISLFVCRVVVPCLPREDLQSLIWASLPEKNQSLYIYVTCQVLGSNPKWWFIYGLAKNSLGDLSSSCSGVYLNHTSSVVHIPRKELHFDRALWKIPKNACTIDGWQLACVDPVPCGTGHK